MSSPPFDLWLEAFLWTCVLEIPVYVLLLGRRFRRRATAPLVALGLNVATHPALWYVFPAFAPYWLYLAAAESCVLAVEWLLASLALGRGLRPERALLDGLYAALAANALSTAFGLALDALGWR